MPTKGVAAVSFSCATLAVLVES